jgi:hypothetical protein
LTGILITTIMTTSTRRATMMEQERPSELTSYVEQWGMLFEQLGATRMMGKVLGWLLICDPPGQTARQIADAIGASISSISIATRALTQAAMIERVGVPGERSARFRVRPGMWSRLIKVRMGHLATMRELADEGLRLLDSPDAGRALRLREIQSYGEFIDRELPALLARWEEEWKGGKS